MIPPLAALLRLHEIYVEGLEAKGRREVQRLLQSLDERLLTRYEMLKQRHGHGAVAEMDRGVCGGCHMRQPGQAITVEEEIYECQNCGRLLYDPDVAYDYSVG